jgi:ABC-2 type transport system ATP-binding protein
MLAHGYGGSKHDLDGEARDLARHGYLVLTWTARGFGASGGLIHLDSPDHEVADARLLIDYLASRPDVATRDGDPLLGVAGASYGGALALLLAGTDPRVDAIVPQITWNDLRRALVPQSVLPDTDPVDPQAVPAAAPAPVDAAGGVFKRAWAGVFFGPGGGGASAARAAGAAGSGDRPDPLCGRLAPELCRDYLSLARDGRPTPSLMALLERSSPSGVLADITAPTLLVQGEADSLFPLGEGDANAAGIAATGTPVKVVWSGGGHDGGVEETDRLRALTTAWFDHYLRGIGGADTRFEATVADSTISSVDGDAAPSVRVAAGAPGIDPGAPSVSWRAIPLTGPEQTLVSPAGGWPAAVTTLPGLGGLSGSSPSGSLAALPGQSAVFESRPLTAAMPVVGAGRVRLRVWSSTAEATLFVSWQDVSPYDTAELPAGLVAPVRLTGIGPAGVAALIQVPAVVHDVAAGHRLRLVVSATDQAYALPAGARTYRVALAAPQLELPALEMAVLDSGGLRRLLPWAIALSVATLLVAGTGLWRRRRIAADPPSAELADVPLVVTDLEKVFANGYRAVAGTSLRVERGWVLGLLGPNGAGKTTVLRMVLGLISPTRGEIRVFGHVVRPGAPVLARVGAFVEGPGLLPHVSGLENLRLYWASTGRPSEQACLEEVLEVAGLADDLHRTVRTYSHGMRQRLAIAQAMLGLPDLLVLDEPTNGLDPPQIREMREVMIRYAETGRTVVVSSHLLAEVEQTCSHVVVMQSGSVVASGAVRELVGSDTALLVDLGGAESEDVLRRAVAVASAVAGASRVRATPSGLSLELVATPRSVLVRALVEAGLDVERVAARRGLEDAFLALVGQEGHDA